MFKTIKVALCVLLLAGVLTACSDDDTPAPAPVVPDVEVEDGEPTAEELAEMAAADKFAAANSVIRALAYINELPDNWETKTFAPEVGVPKDEVSTDIRHLISDGADHAEEYFLSIVPDLGLEGHTWSHEGVGTLTFRAVNEKDCYAVIDVNLVQMPGLTQIRFVPEAVVGDNGFKGIGYYYPGDVVKRLSDNTYWICVRPSGGHYCKDKCYFVSFDKSLIKTKIAKQNICHVDEGKVNKKNKINDVSGEWVYAKNLVEERIAIAAAHTFSMLYGGSISAHSNLSYREKGKYLRTKGIVNFEKLANPSDDGGFGFNIAYGSSSSNKYSKIRQEKLLQPMLSFYHEKLEEQVSYVREILQMVHVKDNTNTPYLLSLTTDHDPLSYNSFKKTDGDWGTESKKGVWDKPFNILNYAVEFQPVQANGETFDFPEGHSVYFKGEQNGKVLLMTQMYIKDHGKKNEGLELLNGHITYNGKLFEPKYWDILNFNVLRKITDEKNYLELQTNPAK